MLNLLNVKAEKKKNYKTTNMRLNLSRSPYVACGRRAFEQKKKKQKKIKEKK